MGYDFYDKPISKKIHNFYLWFWRMGCQIKVWI